MPSKTRADLYVSDRQSERFWTYVDKTNIGGCWEWIGALGAGGYGLYHIGNGQRTFPSIAVAHRIAYFLMRGSLPVDLTLDHLCRNRKCVNPDHLEPTSNRENILRGVGATAINAKKQTCPKGHLYTGDNLYVRPPGFRVCRECQRRANQILRQNRRRKGEVTQ